MSKACYYMEVESCEDCKIDTIVKACEEQEGDEWYHGYVGYEMHQGSVTRILIFEMGFNFSLNGSIESIFFESKYLGLFLCFGVKIFLENDLALS